MTQPINPFTIPRREDPARDDEPNPVPTTANRADGDRAQRAQGYARADAYFTSAAPSRDPACNGPRDQHYDFDRCATRAEPIASPLLFLRQAGDAEAVDSKDVRQGHVGDCAFMAALAALASTPEGRAVIRNAIVLNTDAQGAVVSYTVTLHKPESSWWPFGAKTFSEVRVTVDANSVPGYAKARGTQDYISPDGPHEVWPRVLESAYAALRGGYNAIGHGGSPCAAMEILTGRPATQTRLWLFGPSGAQIAGYVAAGKLVVLDTTKNAAGHHDLENSHAYQVVGATTTEDGRPGLRLHNPWNDGSKDPTVPYDELTKWCSAVDVGTVR